MAGRIRVLDAANKTMQRLGYLKTLCALVNETETSNLASLGKRLIERVTKRIRVYPPLEEDIKDYVKNRLTDRAYRELRKAILDGNMSNSVSLEIQDLYLSSSSLPSRTGKLVEGNWRFYPYIGTAIDLIKKGTYSALTRSLVLLSVTPKEELSAFIEYNHNVNPFFLSDAQTLILLYCFIDNDAELLLPLFKNIISLKSPSFDERIAGDFLPDILRKIVNSHSNKGITIEERERLSSLSKTSNSIEKWKGKPYTGGGPRETAIRVRLEPYCDLKFFSKPNRDRYEYTVTKALRILADKWEDAGDTEKFLQNFFFSTFAKCRGLKVREAKETDAIEALVKAGHDLKSTLGYSPIIDVGLLAGARLLTEKKAVLELSRTTEILRALQKRDPNAVRFTVDRMGAMAFVKFL
jgi:hypothetical protein